MTGILKELLVSDEGQDLVEYALLVAFVGLAAMAAWLAIQNALTNGYINWDNEEQNLSAGPGGTSGPLSTPNPQ